MILGQHFLHFLLFTTNTIYLSRVQGTRAYISLYNPVLYNEMQVVVPSCHTQLVECWGWIKKSHSPRKEAALESGGTTADACVLLARRQQGEQAVAGMGIVF